MVLLSGLLTSMPYFCGFLNTGHDIGFHLERIIGMTGAMESGQFPVPVEYGFYAGVWIFSGHAVSGIVLIYSGNSLYIGSFFDDQL